MILSVDIDEVLNNLVTAVLCQYNLMSGDDLTRDDITDYSVAKFVKPEYREQLSLLWSDPITWHYVEWNVEWVTRLIENKEGYNIEVYFVTATYPEHIDAKFKMLCREIYKVSLYMTEKEVENYVRNHLIVTQDKSMIRTDVIVDDAFENLQLYRQGVKNILVVRPWNKNAYIEYKNKYRHSDLFLVSSGNDAGKLINTWLKKGESI